MRSLASRALAGRALASLLPALLFALGLASCGGVGQDGTGATPPDTYTTGVVNGFGSVVVNGIHFDVRSADIAIDGAGGKRQDDLRVGMVVGVTGRVSDDGLTGTATRLVYESVLRGTVESVSSTGFTFQVLGQQVTVDDTTLFSGIDDITALVAGSSQVEVSGLRIAAGSLRATYVKAESASTTRQFVANITGLSGNTVQLAGLSIDITNAQLVDVARAALAVGLQVRVDLAGAPVAGAAVATRLRLIDTRSGDTLNKQQRQGFVTAWDSATGRFVLNGQTVQTWPAPTTRYDDGTAANLGNGVRVEVTGVRDANGVLQATRVRFLRSSLTGYGRGRVAAVDAANQRFYLLDANGLRVRVRTVTLLNDNTGAVLNLSNLTVGQEVVAVGLATSDGIEAEVVTRLASNPLGSGVAGPATAITASGFTLLGIPVSTGAGTRYFDADGNEVNASVFFSTLQPDELIRAEGVYTPGGTLAAAVVRHVR